MTGTGGVEATSGRAPLGGAVFHGAALGVGAVGIGIDAIEIARVADAIRRRPRFVDRVFTDAEKLYFSRRANPERQWATRFAGKEAVMKALGVGIGEVALRDISISGPGKPQVTLTGRAAGRAAQIGIGRVEISLTHSAEMAIAVAVAMPSGGVRRASSPEQQTAGSGEPVVGDPGESP